ncbi:IS1096 element passenger TnpR family protein [Cupriavidus basilensis]|uniref:IS1096 element passenger TnpR family protein n=1 Tax=Cupriavidus basilensis TaxID=68895 RepID=UPI0023E8CE29|nr:hypothetical protein [Cupriavidus basilensis]MDF3888975.1 hypothetical protein [Cupriavidus basilensis]
MASDPGPATSILQLRIALRGLSPLVWRRVLVPEHLTLTVISKRFVKRQQMAWRPRHAHNLLQIRTAVLNNQLRSYVERWYPPIS